MSTTASISLLPPVAAIRDSLKDEGFSGEFAQQHLKFNSFLDLLPGYTRLGANAVMGVRDCDNRREHLTHNVLYDFVVNASEKLLKLVGASNHDQAGQRVGVVLPNGPEVL